MLITDEAFHVVMDVITAFLQEHDMQVYMVIFDKEAFQISEKLCADIKSYIDDNYVEQHTDANMERMRAAQCSTVFQSSEPVWGKTLAAPCQFKSTVERKNVAALISLTQEVDMLDESRICPVPQQ